MANSTWHVYSTRHTPVAPYNIHKVKIGDKKIAKLLVSRITMLFIVFVFAEWSHTGKVSHARKTSRVWLIFRFKILTEYEETKNFQVLTLQGFNCEKVLHVLFRES